jgi:hypothetical protein
MKTIVALLLLTYLAIPALSRPFSYNFSLGPDYWITSSNKGGTTASLVTAGFRCQGNIFKNFNAEFRGNVGEVSTTRLSYSEFSVLYNVLATSKKNIGCGFSLVSCENVLVKSTNNTIQARKLNLKFQWEQSFSNFWGFYFQAMALGFSGVDFGWLGYFDQELGDFNVRLGYKQLQLDQVNTMNGLYFASSVYF